MQITANALQMTASSTCLQLSPYVSWQVLPRATHRGGRQFQDNYEKGEIVPLREQLSTLFDVEHLLEWATVNDAVFHQVPSNSKPQF